MDFSEVRDLFINIFQIFGPNCKILGLRVDFGKAEGPKCKMVRNFGWGFIFQRISRGQGPRVVNRAGRTWSTVDRRRRGPRVSERGGALTGGWPPAAPVHQSSPAGAQKRERGARGVRLGPHRSSGGGVVTGRRWWREEVTGTRWGGVPAWERRREGLSEV